MTMTMNHTPLKMKDITIGMLVTVNDSSARNPGGYGRVTARSPKHNQVHIDSAEFPGQEVTGWYPIESLGVYMPAPTPPTVTKRIGAYDRDSKDFPAYVIFEDGSEEYIGSCPTQHDASLLASDYIIQFYSDNHTPERAAQLIHEELATEGRHEQFAADMGGVWEGEEPKWCPICHGYGWGCNECAGTCVAPDDTLAPTPTEAELDALAAGLSTMDEVFRLARATAHIPLPDMGRWGHKTASTATDPATEALQETTHIAGHMTCECTECYSLQWCLFDGEVYTCSDQEACSRRQEENKRPAPHMPSELIGLRVKYQRAVADGYQTTAEALVSHAMCEAERYVRGGQTETADQPALSWSF